MAGVVVAEADEAVVVVDAPALVLVHCTVVGRLLTPPRAQIRAAALRVSGCDFVSLVQMRRNTMF